MRGEWKTVYENEFGKIVARGDPRRAIELEIKSAGFCIMIVPILVIGK